jgi:imidazolonepropionase-like amidohydrolase
MITHYFIGQLGMTIKTLFNVLLITATPLSLAQNQWTDIHCGHLLDVEKKQITHNTHILIKNDRIENVGTALSIPAEAKKIDLSDSYCAPGLMDMHVHLFLDIANKTMDLSGTTQSSAYNALIGLKNARILLNQGLTTIRITGDTDIYFANIELRNAINRGDFVGPRMLVAPHAISPMGGHGDFNTFAPDRMHRINGPAVVDGADNLRHFLREEFKYGADWIKVMASGGVISQHDDPNVVAYSHEEFRAMVDETHRHKKKITVHAHSDNAIRAAVEAGVDSVEHGTLMSEDTARLMAKKGTYYVPTLYVLDWIVETSAKGGVTKSTLDKAKQIVAQHDNAVRLAQKHGIKLVIGSDPVFPMDQAIREYAALASRGVQPWDVLRAGTINAAEMLGMETRIGNIRAGKLADIVAMPSNPIEEIKAVEAINFVMKDGQIVRHDSM